MALRCLAVGPRRDRPSAQRKRVHSLAMEAFVGRELHVPRAVFASYIEQGCSEEPPNAEFWKGAVMAVHPTRKRPFLCDLTILELDDEDEASAQGTYRVVLCRLQAPLLATHRRRQRGGYPAGTRAGDMHPAVVRVLARPRPRPLSRWSAWFRMRTHHVCTSAKHRGHSAIA